MRAELLEPLSAVTRASNSEAFYWNASSITIATVSMTMIRRALR